MSTKMQQFVDVVARMPDKRPPEERRQDFDEIYNEFRTDDAATQASRCSQCGVPSCQTHCPLHNNIPDWLKLTAEGRLKEAYELAQETNTFPEICGRICPQDRLCEGNCVTEKSGHGAITIGAVERYITENAWDEGWIHPPTPSLELPQSVGIIGSGAAGLSAADALRRQGYQVTVYERADRAGGMMIYGIPNFKLDKRVIDRRVDQLRQAGITIHLNCEVGTNPSFEEVCNRYDAVLIANGVYQARELGGPGVGLGNIVQALDYLIASNRTGLGDHVAAIADGSLNARDRNVVVIGGGDTAMDCLRTAIRQGAKSVRCLYRRDRENMPGSRREVKNAEEEGVIFDWLTLPKSFYGDVTVRGVHCIGMRLGAPDVTGRNRPEEVPGTESDLPADLVILALGFGPEDLNQAWGNGVPRLTDWGTVRADFRTGATSRENVYAAGDIVRGASLVVWAIRDGREAAQAIHRKLMVTTTPDVALAA